MTLSGEKMMKTYMDKDLNEYYLVFDRAGKVTREYLAGNASWSSEDTARAEPCNSIASDLVNDPRPDPSDNAAYQRWWRRQRSAVNVKEWDGLLEHRVMLP